MPLFFRYVYYGLKVKVKAHNFAYFTMRVIQYDIQSFRSSLNKQKKSSHFAIKRKRKHVNKWRSINRTWTKHDVWWKYYGNQSIFFENITFWIFSKRWLWLPSFWKNLAHHKKVYLYPRLTLLLNMFIF